MKLIAPSILLIAIISGCNCSLKFTDGGQRICSIKADCLLHMCCSKWGYCDVAQEYCAPDSAVAMQQIGTEDAKKIANRMLFVTVFMILFISTAVAISFVYHYCRRTNTNDKQNVSSVEQLSLLQPADSVTIKTKANGSEIDYEPQIKQSLIHYVDDYDDDDFNGDYNDDVLDDDVFDDIVLGDDAFDVDVFENDVFNDDDS